MSVSHEIEAKAKALASRMRSLGAEATVEQFDYGHSYGVGIALEKGWRFSVMVNNDVGLAILDASKAWRPVDEGQLVEAVAECLDEVGVSE